MGNTRDKIDQIVSDQLTPAPARTRFPSPFELPIPPGCEGWEEMYGYLHLFSEDRREFDEGRFWFQDGLHYPEPYYPFDIVATDSIIVGLNQASARLFVVPPSLGVEYRVLNGYVYLSANSVTDEETLGRRAELFAKRGGYYYEHWDELYARWVEKVEQATRELEALEVPELAEFEDESVVTEGRGLGSSHALLVAYDRLLEGADRVLHYHFEFLNLGYGPTSSSTSSAGRPSPGSQTRRLRRWSPGSTSSSGARTKSSSASPVSRSRSVWPSP